MLTSIKQRLEAYPRRDSEEIKDERVLGKSDSSRDKSEDIEVCREITKGAGSIIRKIVGHTFSNTLKS